MTQVELLPCPFCGWRAIVSDHSTIAWYVECVECACDGPVEESREAAIAAWNTRTPSPASPSPVAEGQPVAYRWLYKDGSKSGWCEMREIHPAELASGHSRVEYAYAAQAPKPASAEGKIPTIDLTYSHWEAIQQAARESPWIPPEYFKNDWVADVCSFLREPDSAAEADTAKQRPLGVPSDYTFGDAQSLEELRADLDPPDRLAPIEARGVAPDMVDRAWDTFVGCDKLPLSLWGKLEMALNAALRNTTWHTCEESAECVACDNEALRARESAPAVENVCTCPEHGSWIHADDVKRLVRELDVAINGEAGAAKQASMCDIVAQVKRHGLVAPPSVATGCAGEWLPIESAPMDFGSRVLLGCAEHSVVILAQWMRVGAHGYWKSPCGQDGEDHFCASSPSHWQPLPEPPALSQPARAAGET